LHPDADGTMAEIGTPRLFHRVIIDVDDLVEITGDHLGHFIELLVVELAVDDKAWQSDGGQVADGHFVRRRVLDDLRAKVRAFDGAEVFLVGFTVAASLYSMYGVPVSICA